MATYSPGVVVQRDDTGSFPQIRVGDFETAELLAQAILQLRLISFKLNCLQPGDEEIDDNELDALDLQ